ncbi:universal stress protein [Tsukamurella paurometabola]|uniref:Universal stress protein n=1 Tax=Tsukamurella paurometabola TaxID=2061 RepID=A0A3P8L837_TSUPA|nr:universal stress protein [Tsukamurella paurometabola]MBS4103152.1 universal stress protein [Tsukamurella paurometabola]UEA82787.1 universal stress protein [Tsukamurella paurometabola]VDR39861.1 Universal stress protein family [Tsukamurella paurometabola]
MTIIVAVPGTTEGPVALRAGMAEAKSLGTDLVAVNLGIAALDVSGLDAEVPITVVERTGRGDRDPVDAVLDEIEERDATRLVIAVRRRSVVSKAVLGSISQRLILNSPIPVLAVKAD